MSTHPKISVLHPTARIGVFPSFPRGWRDAAKQWMQAAADPSQVEYVIAVHESRWQAFWDDISGYSSAPVAVERVTKLICNDTVFFGSCLVVRNDGRDCVVDQINAAAAACSGEIIIGTMDDLRAPHAWDAKVSFVFEDSKQGSAGEAVAVFGSGATPERDRALMICGAMSRARYERLGYILNPAFESMFADNYYSWEVQRDVAKGICNLVERLNIEFEHNHPIFGTSESDAVYQLQNRPDAYQIGFTVFNKLTRGMRVIAVMLPGENFSFPVASHQGHLLNYLNGNNWIVRDHRGHTSNVYSTRIELTDCMLQIKPLVDYVLWLDDDNYLEPAQFEMLLADLEEHPELDGVVGWCWCDNDGGDDPLTGQPKQWMMSAGRQTEDLACKKLTLDDWRRAEESGKWLITSEDLAPDYFWSGFPCVLLRGETAKRLGWEAFKPRLIPTVYRGFTSEDTSFFLTVRELGLNFAVDLRVKLPHLKLRAIEPQFVPESARVEVKRAKGELVTA